MRSILVGLDGSTHSTAAADLGIRWARRFNALLVGLGIIDEPSIRRPEIMPIGGAAYKEQRDEALLTDATRQVESILGQFAIRCTEAGIAYKLLEDVGTPPERIFVESQRFDLILLGQKTHFRFSSQDEEDDTLTEVLRNSPRPVVATPTQPPTGEAVVVAYDGSLQAARALQSFQASGLGTSTKLHVVSLGDDHVEAARHADRAVQFLSSHDLAATPHVASAPSGVAQTLLELSRLLDAGLIVMGCYGRSTLSEFFLGSVTRTMLESSTVPLFLYH
jgi:nucleotide-binding universal stress UspA family protein